MQFTDPLVCQPWTTVEKVEAACCKLDCPSPGDNDELIEEAIEIASNILYMASGRQFAGTCTEIVRPCVDCACADWDSWYLDTGVAGFTGSFFGRGCSCCTNYKRIDLGYWPVTDVTEVNIEGTIIDPDLYHVESFRYLVATPVEENDWLPLVWPTCQRMDRPVGAPLTFAVTIEHGQPIPPAGVRAASKLACEWVALCTGQPCSLPDGIKGIQRQGVSFDLEDPTTLRQLGLFGIREVDIFLTVYNPGKLQSPAFAWSPDLDVERSRRWT